MYLSVLGSARISVLKNHQNIKIGMLKEGSVFGEMSVLLEKSSNATASIICETTRLEAWQVDVSHCWDVTLVNHSRPFMSRNYLNLNLDWRSASIPGWPFH